MTRPAAPRVGVRSVAALLAFAASSVTAHSWIESAYKVAPNGTFIGAPGFPRGYIPRTDPGFSDKQAQNQLPEGGVYKGTEVLNKSPLDPNPKQPMLQAAAGDKVAILHLENGHVTLPQNQANKPLNRGTIFLYGTTQPKAQEKLFDVHLKWNQDGTGGDKRGKLLATRNYDDGQCFQDNKQNLAQQRVTQSADDGAKLDKELKCQSAITIPADAKPGTIYTVYWYWDWPTLNPDKIDMQATKQGQFPWGGSFVRGDKVPNGWTKEDITINESYASTIDIKIVPRLPGLVAAEGGENSFVNKQDIYMSGIKKQLDSDFDVQVPGMTGGSSQAPANLPSDIAKLSASAKPSAKPSAASPSGPQCSGASTVTDFVTTTVFVTATPSPARGAGAAAQPAAPEPVTVFVTSTVHVPTSAATPAAAAPNRDGPLRQLLGLRRRENWAYGSF
ncbi:hypothetical protein HIM_03149 [Hirsutella minnesotensis 3608]|nr:hypothetical protein HIM_03149 [Hirsutella minnesotensis 3608]